MKVLDFEDVMKKITMKESEFQKKLYILYIIEVLKIIQMKGL